MTFFQNIVLSLAKRLGLKLMVAPSKEPSDYIVTTDISITAAIANSVATLTMMDSTIAIKGSSARAAYLDNLFKDVIIDKLDVAAEVALGTGDCLLKPYTDGTRIGIDIIRNGNFYICDHTEDFIKSIVIRCEEFTKNDGNHYERYEVHRLREAYDEFGNSNSAIFIYQFAYRNGTEISIQSVPEWADIEPETVIWGVDSMLFGRIKSPIVNRENINSPVGVSVTYGLDSVIKKCKDAYERFNDEYDRKEAYVFASKQLFIKERKEDGSENIALPRGKERIFVKFNNRTADPEMIHEYSPEIRHESLIVGIEENFKMLEMLAGFSPGVLTEPTTNAATATEIRSQLQKTFAFMTKYRRSIEKGIRALFSAISTLCNINNITPYGEYDIVIDWSSAYIENLTEQYQRMLQGYDKGAILLPELRAWLLDKSVEEAAAELEEANAEQNKNNAVDNSSVLNTSKAENSGVSAMIDNWFKTQNL